MSTYEPGKPLWAVLVPQVSEAPAEAPPEPMPTRDAARGSPADASNPPISGTSGTAAAKAEPVDAADALTALGYWALQFTPKVALFEGVVLMEISASLRLFGGEEALRDRLVSEGAQLGCEVVSFGPTARGTLALARCGVVDGFSAPLPRLLDRLPLASISEVAAHAPILSRTGCKTLGDVRRLPRGGLSRRFSKQLLLAMDQAYGLAPVAFEWAQAPQTFSARLELPGRVELAQGLLFGARRLLLQMAGWLAARHAGVQAFTLRFKYTFHRPRDVPDWGEITVRTAEITREIDHFSRLLSEHLAKTTLGAAVEELILVAGEALAQQELSASLLQDTSRAGDTPTQLIERLSARLGPGQVVRAQIRSDHRPERVQTWVDAALGPARTPSRPPLLAELPQPTWLLTKPLRLAVRGERPIYQGRLQPRAGPYRVEAGWWDRELEEVARSGVPQLARRDYYVMLSEHAGLLWVYRDLSASAATTNRTPLGMAKPAAGVWFLHGIFG